jgi:hypothetical protein
MTRIPILNAEKRWECPNCDLKDVTHEAGAHSRMHTCRGIGGLVAPMVPEGTRCKAVAKVREDYVGREDVTYDPNGRPIMAVEVTRDEGTDVAVLAPCASMRFVQGI